MWYYGRLRTSGEPLTPPVPSTRYNAPRGGPHRGSRPASGPLPPDPQFERRALPAFAAGGLPHSVHAGREPALVEPGAHVLVLRQEHPRTVRPLLGGRRPAGVRHELLL